VRRGVDAVRVVEARREVVLADGAVARLGRAGFVLPAQEELGVGDHLVVDHGIVGHRRGDAVREESQPARELLLPLGRERVLHRKLVWKAVCSARNSLTSPVVIHTDHA